MIKNVLQDIASSQEEIINHPLYKNLKLPSDLQCFMEYHVYAVWDFMSLLKALQIKLTRTTLPWVPVGSPEIRYLINEIVLAEETDLNMDGERESHFEMYLDAMKDAGASADEITQLTQKIFNGTPFYQAISMTQIPTCVRSFLSFTFSVIETGEAHKIASAFTFGREDLIPKMFSSIISSIQRQFPEENLNRFNYYFQRHIELDDDTHGPLALKMIEGLCGKDQTKWQEVTQTALEALSFRKKLWDGVLEEINKVNRSAVV